MKGRLNPASSSSSQSAVREHINSDPYVDLWVSGEPSIWNAFGAGRHLSDSTSLEMCQRMVPSWIVRCGESHTSCDMLQDSTGFTPTRLIHVGTASTDPHLVEHLNSKAPYIALSYCWGTKRPLTTTRETLSQHCKAMTWSSIPVTFQDVMILARSLGIEYIWIDAMCIVQDDVEDWNREAALMASVYSNSYFTIAPLTAHDAETGIFHKSAATPSVRKIPAPGADGVNTVIYARQALTHMQSSRGYPLLQRGWTYQEQLLSPRVLYVEEYEISWECNAIKWCCCQHEHDVTDFIHHHKADFSRFLRTRHIEPYIGSRLADKDRLLVACRHMWQKLTSSYTQKLLTKLSDRLIALAGIATVFSQVKQCRYVAGLWEDDIVHGLLWYCSEAENESWRASPEFIAPSWSWASVDCGIAYHAHVLPRLPSDPEIQIELVDVSSTLAGTGAYGAVSEACIKFKGKLATGSYEFEEWAYRPSSTHKIVVNGTPAIFVADYHCAALYFKPLRDGDELHCLLLWDNKVEGRKRAGLGLVIRQTVKLKDAKPTFERVGLCTAISVEAMSWFEDVKSEIVCLI